MTLEEATDKIKNRLFELGEMVESQRAQIESMTRDYHAMLGGLQELKGLLAVVEPEQAQTREPKLEPEPE
jgi:hypothetical protein